MPHPSQVRTSRGFSRFLSAAIAVEEGATHVRLGTLLFGARAQ